MITTPTRQSASSDAVLREALKTALGHIEHMAAYISNNTVGYSFESVSEDMPDMRAALSSTPSPAVGDAKWPKNLHPATMALVQGFATALAKKLRLAEEKHGFKDDWSRDDWEAECRDHLYQHLEKGDPLDVAAYCAFMWHHGWTTYRASLSSPAAGSDGWQRDAALEEAAQVCVKEASRYDATNNQENALAGECLACALLIRALKSAAPTQTDGWQPIETAPKDGTPVLLFGLRDGRTIFAVDWYRREKDGVGFVGWGKFNMQYWPPTLWRPLPPAPTPSTASEE